MVGGTVIGLTRKDGKTHVHVADCPHYPPHGSKETKAGRGLICPRPQTCCVYTDEIKIHGGERIEIQIGDSFWWQSGYVFWTPKENRGKRGGVDYDIKLTKLGYSH